MLLLFQGKQDPFLIFPGLPSGTRVHALEARERRGLWHRQLETKQVGFFQNVFWVHPHQNLSGIRVHHIVPWVPFSIHDVQVVGGDPKSLHC